MCVFVCVASKHGAVITSDKLKSNQRPFKPFLKHFKTLLGVASLILSKIKKNKLLRRHKLTQQKISTSDLMLCRALSSELICILYLLCHLKSFHILTAG